MRTIQFIVGFLLFVSLEILRVYFIMPFPGSQESETIDIAYFLHENIFWLRTIAILILIFPTLQFFLSGKTVAKWYVGIALGIALYIFLMTNYKLQADKMFYQPKVQAFTSASAADIKGNQLVLGVEINGESKAYPVEVIGYHHQIRDTIGNQPVMVTYCTVCRTGRVFKPIVDGEPEVFRLVGMDHFNAMFEDSRTGSWWRQVNGEAVAGPKKGSRLEELPSFQTTLRAWLDEHPQSKVLAADTSFNKEYEGLKKYDEGRAESSLLHRDSLSWQKKSWVVGVRIGRHARAYDWNHLTKNSIINDTLGSTKLVIVIESDTATFHVWKTDSLTFELFDGKLRDVNTESVWNWKGEAQEGPLAGEKLQTVQSYQEFWHSWKTFNPATTQFPQK